MEQCNSRRYEAMTLDGVARRAGASKATLYRRWGGKQGLVLAALAGFKDDDSTSADTGGLRDDLIALARSVNDASDRTGGLLGALAHAVQHDVELAAAVESELGSRCEPGSPSCWRALSPAVSWPNPSWTIRSLPTCYR